MAFIVPTTIGITGLAKNISRSIIVTEEIVTQVEVAITSGSTDEEVFLGILDITKVKAFTLITDRPVTYNFSPASGQNFPLDSMVSLPGMAAESFQEYTEVSGGTLVVGQQYYIKTYNGADDFSNVGAPISGATGVSFVATGTTPLDWSGNSVLVTKPKALLNLYFTNPGTSTANVQVAIVTQN